MPTGLRWLIATLLLGVATIAAALVAIPPLTTRVTDTTATLTPVQLDRLERQLAAFEAKKGSQITILMVPTTAPETIEQYSLRVVEQWKIGRERVDDGVLLIVAKNDHTLRIEVGYGLEGAVTDVTGSRIIREVIAPYFQQNNYYGGLSAGIDAITRAVDGEALPAPASAPDSGDPRGDPQSNWVAGFVIIVLVGSLLRSMLGRLPGATVTGVIAAVIGWFVLGTLLTAVAIGFVALGITLLGIGPGLGGYYGHHHGGGGFGGFRGGGGRFGGGGASGRW